MPLSFLANLGSGLARLGSAFGRGAVSAGKGIGRGLKRIGDLGEDDLPVDQPSAPTSQAPILTPPFNPTAGGGVRVIEDAVAGAENEARADFGAKPLPLLDDGPPDLPISRRDLPIPALPPAPEMDGMRSGLPSLPAPRKVTPAAALSPAAANMEAPKIETDLDRRNLPIPRLPGHAGGPAAYSPIEAARYDSVMKHAKRDAEGNLISMSEGGGFRRDWGTTLRNAFLAASAAARSAGPGEDPLGAAIGGALTGGVGSAINPQAGYEFAFDFGERPRLEAELQREQAAKGRANLEILNQAKLEGIRAETGLKGAQADKARADVEIGRQAEERQRLAADSERRLNEARILAELTGVERVEDIFNPETGAFERVAIYPGGKTQVIGRSGEAEMKQRDIRSREKIAREGETAATGRTAMTQAGEDRRAKARIESEERLAAGDGGGLPRPSAEGAQSGQRVTPDQLRRYAESRKLSLEEARKKLREMKYEVD
jgi:hypothetical protein